MDKKQRDRAGVPTIPGYETTKQVMVRFGVSSWDQMFKALKAAKIGSLTVGGLGGKHPTAYLWSASEVTEQESRLLGLLTGDTGKKAAMQVSRSEFSRLARRVERIERVLRANGAGDDIADEGQLPLLDDQGGEGGEVG